MRKLSFLGLAAITAALILPVSQLAAAQEEKLAENTSISARLDKIEQLLSTLERRLETVESGSSQARVSGDAPREEAALQERIEALDQGLRIIQRKKELESETAAAQSKTNPILGVGPSGFFLRSADNAFSLNLRSNIQADARFYGNGSPAPGASTFVPYKVRLYFDGTVYKNFSFRLMPDFGNGSTSVQDAYVDAAILPWLKLRGGKAKGPVGLERLVADTDVEFYERSLVTNLVPNRDIGFQLYGDPWSGLISYAGGIFNGVADGSSADLDTDNHHEFEGRLFAHPFRKTGVGPIQGFGVGLAGTSGREIGTSSSPYVAGYKTSSQQSFFRFRSDGTAAGTTLSAGDHARISPQAYYYWRSFGSWAEYAKSSQDVRRGVTRATLDNTAWQVAATYFLTGEKASYRNVVPSHNFNSRQGYWGAVEVTARYAQLDVDKSAFPTFADPAAAAAGAKTWTTGINWYINKNTKFVFNYEQTSFMKAAGGVLRKDEHAFLERLQLAF